MFLHPSAEGENLKAYTCYEWIVQLVLSQPVYVQRVFCARAMEKPESSTNILIDFSVMQETSSGIAPGIYNEGEQVDVILRGFFVIALIQKSGLALICNDVKFN